MENDTTDPKSTSGWDKHASRYIATMAFALFALGTIAYRLLEGWEWVDSFYFSAVALTTVGFGDFTPTTTGSKLFTVFYIIGGIALITTYLNMLAKRLALRTHHRRRDGDDDG